MIIEVVLKDKSEIRKNKNLLENKFDVNVKSLIGMEVGSKEIPLYILRFEADYLIEPIEVYSIIQSKNAKIYLTPSA